MLPGKERREERRKEKSREEVIGGGEKGRKGRVQASYGKLRPLKATVTTARLRSESHSLPKHTLFSGCT